MRKHANRAIHALTTALHGSRSSPPLVCIDCGQGVISLSKKLPIFYSALLLTGVNLLLRLVGTSFQVYLSGRIGAAGIGLLQLTMSVGSLSLIAGIAGARTATMYLTAEELGKHRPQSAGWVLSGCFLYSILCGGTVAAGLYIFAPEIASRWIGDGQTVDALRLLAVFLPVSCLCSVMTGFFTAANRIGTLATVEVGEQLCSMAVTLALLELWAGSDPGRACLCVVLGSGIGSGLTLICLIVLRLRERVPLGPRIPVARRLAEAAVPLALADILKAGISTTENLMVPKRLSLCQAVTDPLASFGMLSGMVFPVLMFPACILYGLAELLIPELARCAAGGNHRRIGYLAKRSLHIAMLYGFFFGGTMFLTAQWLCTRLYGSMEAGHLLKRYALLIPMLYCDAITDAMTKGLGQQTACVRYNILTNSLDVCLLFLLLPRYGMEGYFFSFLLTHVLNFALSLRRLLKITALSLSPVMPMLVACACVLSIGISALLTSPLLRCGAFAIIFFCGLYLAKVVGKEDLLWLSGLLSGKSSAKK